MNKNPAAIGILGDGQLALMLGESASKFQIPFMAFGADHESSVANFFPKSHQNLTKLEGSSPISVLTLENEFVSVSELRQLESRGFQIVPDSASYSHFDSKIHQREFYRSLEIPSPQWMTFPAGLPGHDLLNTVHRIEQTFSYPVILKASQGGYDGYGVRKAADSKQLETALRQLGWDQGKDILIEEAVKIRMELAQGALFNGKGGWNALPLVETIQKDGICEVVLSQPSLKAEELADVQKRILTILKKIATSHLLGLFNFEFFLTESGEILINEGAPRPHNSQHLSLNACPVSQFDLVIRFIQEGRLPLPNGEVIQAVPSAMINLLGQTDGENYSLYLPELPKDVGTYPKLYGKKKCRPGRKMGHLVLVDPSGKQGLLALARKVLKEYRL